MRRLRRRPDPRGPARRGASGAAFGGLLAGCLIGHAASAANLGNAGGFDWQWTTTLSESVAFRATPPAPALLSDINGDDGDRAFGTGLASARFDADTELTAQRGGLGLDVSARAWWDPVYFQRTANTSRATFNPVYDSYDREPQATRDLLGLDAEIGNAFISDRFDAGDVPITVRVGRQVALWGESLYFASNGIAGAQAPVDEIRALSTPLPEARDLYLPVTQAVLRVQITPSLALELYDQAEWRRDRLPGVGSYFSAADYFDASGLRYFLAGAALYRTKDEVPRGPGQFGAALRWQSPAADFGVYALRFDAKLPEPVFDTGEGTYRLVFPRDIWLLGASASTYVGAANVAGEVSWRHRMPLLSPAPGAAAPGDAQGGGAPGIYAAIALPPPPPPPSGAAGYATGDTWHAQASVIDQLPPQQFWQGAAVTAEIAANDLIAIDTGHRFAVPGRTHFAAAAEAVFEPSYYQVLPHTDLSVPIGIGYTVIGRSSIDGAEQAGSGSATMAARAVFRSVWQFTAAYTQFIGSAGRQRLADRNYAFISVSRSF